MIYLTLIKGLIRSIGEEPLHSLLKELGGWPVVNGSTWNPTASIEVLMGKSLSHALRPCQGHEHEIITIFIIT